MLIDTHAHLEMFPRLDQVITTTHAAGVSRIITVGTTLATSKQAIKIAQKYPSVFASIAIYPWEIQNELLHSSWTSIQNQLHKLAQQPKVVAIGETGLDYHTKQLANLHPEDITKAKSLQAQLYQIHLDLAATLHLPLIIHNREAHHHILQPIKQTNQKLARQLPLTGVFHCFSGDETFLNQILQLGFYVSFAGNLTYPSSLQLQKLAPLVPSHKLLIETDAPLLPPEPLRSSLNQLAHSNEDRTKFYKIGSCVKITAEYLARLRHTSPEQIETITTQNGRQLFGI